MNPLALNHLSPISVSPIADDVVAGLSAKPKRLPPRLFYDETGSDLFEQITALPEYYLSRTERAIFTEHASEILQKTGEGLTLIELGAGTASKTKVIIDALLQRQMSATFYPVDVSASALEIARESLKAEFPRLTVRPLVGDYSAGLQQLSGTPGRKLVLYIGSSIGNFEPDEAGALLKTIRSSLTAGDALLLGADMVKPEPVLLAAYNDAQGVTARFNMNILARINRELGGDFELDSFRHKAIWNAADSRIEMHLESLCTQVVYIADLERFVAFRRGETIHTENSYKFTPEMIYKIVSMGGFKLEETWIDEQNWFGVHLARVRED
jgi:L-histidine N-alpha-methyltransferase